MKRSDRDIWADLMAGRSQAWNEIVDKYQPLVYAVATRAGLSMADAADCFQQTFVLLYQNRQKISDPSRISAWLVTTSKRESIRLSRQARAVRDSSVMAEQVDASPLADETLERLESQSRLEIGLGQLDDRCRALLRALFFSPEELSYEQVAKSVGIAFNSLGPIRGRCLNRLKKILEEQDLADVRK
ncbi:MAG: sigma-70 family RNA polymerase sigma factor [bacterium]|nr:sigma-70 family RNA polymerase sigma factor [bacterium]